MASKTDEQAFCLVMFIGLFVSCAAESIKYGRMWPLMVFFTVALFAAIFDN